MIERQEAEHHVGVGKHGRVGTDELINVRHQIVVREHHALGQSGGAAGVGKRGDGLRGVLSGLRKFGRRWAEQVRKWLGAGVLTWHGTAGDEDAAQVGECGQIDVLRLTARR